ncbi:MAG: SufD family Fe-S cluster assembly protein [Acutalibacteraceae bacterium]|nr:SufD family Fe-S cluster assembly protein [Acutalibacteraceae bacterium]
MNEFEKKLLKEVADLDSLPVGAYNIRSNGESVARNTTANIDIVTKKDKPGIDIIIAKDTKNESVHIPVVISESGIKESVYNDFFIEPNCDVTIIAGCGIHNCGGQDSKHDGIHSFFIGENSKVRYIEKHYGEGDGTGKRVMNPETNVILAKNAHMEIESSQIAGVDDTVRKTTVTLGEGSVFIIKDSILTTGKQKAIAEFYADLNGNNCSCNIISRGVARDNSYQNVISHMNGNAACNGHSECDSILMEKGIVIATPQLKATNTDASLIHEAAIGKIAGEQLTKLMTLGLDEKEAEEQIIFGFLKHKV